MRIDEFKGVVTAEIENGVVQKGDWGGFSGPIFTDSAGGIVFNLYTNPQEDVSVGIRHIPVSVAIMGVSAFYLQELIKYPSPANRRARSSRAGRTYARTIIARATGQPRDSRKSGLEHRLRRLPHRAE